MDHELPNRLVESLALPRSPAGAWSRFAPELTYGRHSGPPPHDAKQAAVIALLYPETDDWIIPLTLRPADMEAHGGQVCFPGGVTEPSETSQQSALRELEEELGICPADLRILGQLSSIYVFASNFLVTPFVAATSTRPDFRPSPDEVAEIVNLPLAVLRDENNYGSHEIHRGPLHFRAPHVQCNGHRIWGATSMMLAELKFVLDD